MNKHLHRIIFNKARGLFMVVQETASSVGGSVKGAAQASSPAGLVVTFEVIRFAVLCACGVMAGLSPLAQAQIVADPAAAANQRAIILNTANGLPLVNIQTPSAAGVSRNIYNRFDVSAGGAVLNNSRTNVQTQLGGFIQGNPMLATGSARVILNEVNSANPSQLRGYVEVGGQRAEVIIANPAGIAVDGGGFINASRVTLTTGTPLLNALSGGALEGYRVQRGTITIDGAGLDTGTADYTGILARAVQANAGVWARELKVVTGANDVDAAQAVVTHTTGTGPAPTFALDVAQLGGMYANHIFLIGTEAGVGVRNAGVIGATQGDLVLQTNGWLTNSGTLQGQTNTALQASGVTNSGQAVAGQTLTIATPGLLDNSAGTLSAQRLDVSAASLVNRGGAIEQTGSQGLVLQSASLSNAEGGQVGQLPTPSSTAGTSNTGATTPTTTPTTLTAASSGSTGSGTASTATSTTTPVAPVVLADGLLDIAGSLNNDAGRISAAGGLDLTSQNGLNNDGGTLRLRQLTVTGGNLGNQGGTLATSGDMRLNTGQIDNRAGTLSASGQLRIDAQGLDNTGGEIVQTGTADTVIRVDQGTFDNTRGRLATNAANLSITAAGLLNTDGKLEHAGTGSLSLATGSFGGARSQLTSNGSLQADIAGSLNNTSGSLTAASVQINAASLDNSAGHIVQTGAGATSIQTTGLLDNRAGTLASNGQTSLNAASIDNRSGTVQTSGSAALTLLAANTLDNGQGQITAGGALQATAGQLQNTSGLIAANGAVQLTATTLDNTGGTIASVKDQLDITTTGTLANDAGRLQALGDVALSSGALRNAGGNISGQNLTIATHGAALGNAGGTIAAVQSATLVTGALNNDAGLIQTGGDLSIDTGAQMLTNTGAARYTNGQGGITSQGTLTLATGDLNNAAGFIGAKGDLIATTAQVSNTAGGLLVGQSRLAFTSTGFDNKGGQVQAVGDITIDAGPGALDNTASLIRSGGAVHLAAASIVNSNTLGTDQGIEGQDVTLQASTLANDSGAVRADRDLTIATTGSFGNASGLLSAGRAATLQAGSIVNTGGTVIGGTAVTLTAGTIGGDGKLLSQGDMVFNTTADFNNSSEVIANGNLTFSSTANLTNSGKLQAGNILTVAASNIDNTATGEMSGTTTRVTATGTLTNRGLIDGQTTEVNAATLDNIGTGRLYGDHLSIQAGTINNLAETIGTVTKAGTIAARERLDIGVGTLSNSDGALIFSGGDMAIGGALDAARRATGQAGDINNLSASIETEGALKIDTQRLLNERRNVNIHSQQVLDENVQLGLAAWQQNGANEGIGSLRGSSNYKAFTGYYLDPASIVEVTPLVTPDGVRVWRAVVNLSGNESAFNVAFGGAYGSVGARDRLPVAPGQTVIYYIDRQDGVSNPDQVSGASPAVSNYTTPVTQWESNITTYDPAYGNCSTQCILLVTPLDYTTPDSTIYYRRDGGGGLEVTRDAHHTVVQDFLNADVGAPALISSGGDMQLNIGTSLTNRYATIAAGRNLFIDGQQLADGTSSVKVSNIGQQLFRVHTFENTTHTLGGGSYSWSNPSLSEQVGEVQARIIGNANVAINAGALGNLNNGATPINLTQQAQGPGGVSSGLPAGTVNGGVQTTVPLANQTGQAQQVRTASFAIQLPTASLYSINANPGGHYLIETDPRFANYRNWLGSDYLLSALGLDPNATQKRLGDGFYEQRLIREQVAQLTGRRFLGDYTSDEQEYQALMDSGLTFAHAWGLVPGVALTAAQMAQLTSDIVWLVERVVTLADGSTQRVLVPQVYVRVRDGDLDASGSLIAGGSVNANLNGDLTNSGSIAGRQIVSLTADNIQNLGGRIQGNDVDVSARTDLNNIGGTITAASSLYATAGSDINNVSTVRVDDDVRSTASRQSTAVDRVAGLYVTGANGQPGVLVASAGRDVNLIGSTISNASEGGVTYVAAERDVNLRTLATSSGNSTVIDARNYQRQSQSGEVGSTIEGAGDVYLSAGRDITARQANVQAGGALTVRAGNDVTIESGEARQSSDIAGHSESSGFLSSGSNTLRISNARTDVVASNFGGKSVTLVSGKDINLTGSNVTAQNDANLIAGRDVNISNAEGSYQNSFFSEEKKSGFSGSLMNGISYGKSAQDQSQNGQGTTVVGSSVSGANVGISAGRDTVITASAILADRDVTLNAGRNLDVRAATETSTTQSDAHSSSTSIGLTPGLSGRFTLFGKTSAEQGGDGTTKTAVTSLISANGGNLTMRAGTDDQYKGTGQGNVTTQGADLLAQDRVSISGNAVHLGEADSSSTSRFHAESKSVTLGSQLTGVVGSQVGRIGALAEQSSQTPNSRLANASALKAAYDAYQLTGTTAQGIDGINAAADKSAVAAGGQAGQGDPGKSAFGISIGLGTSKSSQDSSQSSTQQRGTNIQAGNIDITAREGDISGIGTRMQAKNIDLDAAGAIDFRPTTNTATYSSSNSASSSGVGVTFGLGEQNGVSFQVGASNAKGEGNGSETTYGNSQIIASGTLTTKSGGDTNLIGTQFAGNTVKMDVGGNLNIQTLQDTSTYDSKQTNAGFGVNVCLPPLCYGTPVTGSVGAGKNTVDHNYLSATNQAGISAGSGGFDINVKGNTDLKGAALTSTADKDKNSLTTGSLTFSDLENKQTTSSSSESASFGYGGGSGLSTLANNVTGNVLSNALGGAGQPKEQNQTSQTLSIISPANVTITGTGDKAQDDKSQQNASTLTERDATTANGALTNTLTLQQAQDLLAQQQKAKENAAAAQYIGAVMDNVIGDLGVKYGWAEGGAEKTALHGLSGLIQGKVAGTNGLAGLAAGAANELLLPQIKDYLIAQGYAEGTAEFNALLTAGSTLVGAAVGAASGNAGTGASVAFTGTVNNYLKHTELLNLKKSIDNCKAEKCSEGAYKIIIDAYVKTSEANNASLAACTTQSCIDEHVQLINEARPLAEDVMRSIDNGQSGVGVLNAMQKTTNLLDAQQKKVITYESQAKEFAQYAKANCGTGTFEGCVQRYTDLKTGTIRALQDAKDSAGDFWAEMAFDPDQSAAKKFLSVTGSTLASLLPSNTGEIALLVGPGLLGKIKPVGTLSGGVNGGVTAIGSVVDANFAQSTIRASEIFSNDGIANYSQLAGRPIITVDDLASALRSGTIKPSQLPIDYVVATDGTKLILNTRTSVALDRAGVPKSDWYGTNKTGVSVPDMPGKTFDDLAADQLKNNKLPPTGTPTIPTGKK